MNEIKKVVEALRTRFAEALPYPQKRRVLFWNDTKHEFTEHLEAIAQGIADIAKVERTGGYAAFALKERILLQEPGTNFLVYSTEDDPEPEYDLLLPLRMLEKNDSSFRADRLSLWMEGMGIPSNSASLRQTVERYQGFFEEETNRNSIAALPEEWRTSSGRLVRAIMASACHVDPSDEPSGIVRALLKDNALLDALRDWQLESALCQWLGQYFAFFSPENTLDLSGLADHLLLTAAAHSTAAGFFDDLRGRFSMACHNQCHQFVDAWLHDNKPGEAEAYARLARAVEERTGVRKSLEAVERESLVRCAVFPCIDEIIICGLMQEIARGGLVDAEVKKVIAQREGLLHLGSCKAYYDNLSAVADMMRFAREHSGGFHERSAKALWSAYEKELYQMDSFYRHYHQSKAAIEHDGSDMAEASAAMAPAVEQLYTKHITALSRNWTELSASHLENPGYMENILKQENFYDTFVRGDKNRVVVIISDALRYETAAELAIKLRADVPGDHCLHSSQGIFPTETKFGMAALLPHVGLGLEEGPGGMRVLVDGKCSDAGYRQALLEEAKPGSVVLRYEDVAYETRQARKDMMKGPVTYIYHDTIDCRSHADEEGVFPACQQAINELAALVRKLASDQATRHILVTSDHGFLFTGSPLKEMDMAGHAFNPKDVVDKARRYVITREPQDPGDMLPVQLLRGRTPFHAYTPRELIRLKLQGAGRSFVHGGASLQEMMVPVIEVKTKPKRDEDDKERYEVVPAKLQLLGSDLRYCTRFIALNFLQTEPVGDLVSPSKYTMYFINDRGEIISNRKVVDANLTAQNDKDRIIHVDFELYETACRGLRECQFRMQPEQGPEVKATIYINIQTFIDDGNDFF